jgi:prepilin-type processing-associated H-X9-DG protein
MESFPFPPERVWIPEPGLATLLHIAAVVLLILGMVLLKVRRKKPVTWRQLSIGIVLTVSVFVLSILAQRCHLSSQPDFVSILVVCVPVAVLAAIAMVVVELTPGGPPPTVENAELESLDDESDAGGQALQARGVRFARTIMISSILTGCVFVWLVPAVEQAREAARLSSCRCRFCSIILDAHNQAAKRDRRFPGPATQTTDRPPRSWRLEGSGSWDEFDRRNRYRDSEPWDSPHNIKVGARLPQMFDCPTRPAVEVLPGKVPATAHAMITGPHAYGTADGRKIDDFPDGLGQTIAFAEAAGRKIPWTEPRNVELDDHAISVNQPGREPGTSSSMISSHHPGRAIVVFADGSSRSISEKIDPNVLRALLTADGGETIPDTYD